MMYAVRVKKTYYGTVNVKAENEEGAKEAALNAAYGGGVEWDDTYIEDSDVEVTNVKIIKVKNRNAAR